VQYAYRLAIFFIALVQANHLLATSSPFRIAALYSQGRLDYSIDSYGPEAICITEAAVKQAQKDGLKVSLTIVDSRWSPVATSQAAQTVVDGKYDAAVGTISSQEALVAARMLNEAKIPFVTPTATHPDVTYGKPFALRILFNDDRQASLLAKLTATELKPKKIAIVRNTSNPYSDFLAKKFTEDLERLSSGIQVTDFPIFSNFNEYRELIGRVVATKPDLVFVPLWEPQVAAVYSELARRHAKLTVLASDTIDGKVGFIKLLDPMPKDLPFIFSSYWNGKIEGPKASEYQKLHAAYCPLDPPSRVSAAAFDAITLVLEALKKGKPTNTKEFVSRMKSLKLKGLTGLLDFGGDGDPEKPVELFKISNNKTSHWKRYE
jgi:branched-chain amino acid transport system substrate-binding protein